MVTMVNIFKINISVRIIKRKNTYLPKNKKRSCIIKQDLKLIIIYFTNRLEIL